MTYSEIFAILNASANDPTYVTIGVLKRVLQELFMSLPASPAPLDSGPKIQGG